MTMTRTFHMIGLLPLMLQRPICKPLPLYFPINFPLYLRHHSFRPTKVQRMKETAKEEFGSEVPVACYDGCSLLGLNHRSLLISFLILLAKPAR